jgi:hypothetical protein
LLSASSGKASPDSPSIDLPGILTAFWADQRLRQAA